MRSASEIRLRGLDFFLGGVIPAHAQIQMYGPKGSGKSTLADQVADSAAVEGARVGFLLTEQPAADHAQMLKSLGIRSKFEVREVPDPAVLAPLPDVDLIVVDSGNGLGHIRSQTTYRAILGFVQLCRRRGIATLLLSHATKAGSAVGPSSIQHAVDAVLKLSPVGGNHILQVEKRRRLGAWASTRFDRDATLILGSRGFYPSPHAEPAVATTIGFAGGRLVSVQALICLPPRRLHCPFLPLRRVKQLLDTLKQHAGIDVDPEQVGLSVLADGKHAPTLDLALAVAITASYLHKQVPHDVAFVGGLGLNGLVLPVGDAATAVAAVFGDGIFNRVFVSASSEGLMRELVPHSVKVIGVSTIAECISLLRS